MLPHSTVAGIHFVAAIAAACKFPAVVGTVVAVVPISFFICMGLVALLANSLFSVLLVAATVLSSLSMLANMVY